MFVVIYKLSSAVGLPLYEIFLETQRDRGTLSHSHMPYFETGVAGCTYSEHTYKRTDTQTSCAEVKLFYSIVGCNVYLLKKASNLADV